MAPRLHILNSTLTRAQHLFDESVSSPLCGLEFWVFCSVFASLVAVDWIVKWNERWMERVRAADEVEEKLVEYMD